MMHHSINPVSRLESLHGLARIHSPKHLEHAAQALKRLDPGTVPLAQVRASSSDN